MRHVALCVALMLIVASIMVLPVFAAGNTKGGFTPLDLPERKAIMKTTMDFSIDPDVVTTASTDKWAVIIGISDYYGTGSDLQYCDDDAYDVQWVLINKYGFPSANIKMLIDGQATYANIISAIDWLLANETSASTAVFYYSGHGTYKTGDPDGDGEYTDEAIVPWELSRLYDGTLATKFNNLDSLKSWFSFDSCYAGGMNDAGITGTGTVDTMGCKETELCGESSSVRNGFFTYLMVDQSMRYNYGDTNGNGLIETEEAFTYAKNNMYRYSSTQHPVVNDQYTGYQYIGG